jgi:CubicO group peptidase (beta-lactamase class C family)
MKLGSTIVAVMAALVFGTGASAQVPPEMKPAKPAAVASVQPPVTPAASAPALSKQDLDSWLDGYIPYALASADIAGAVVVVVKDGQVLTEKGYGFADVKSRRLVDPQATLFRPGSVSKLFTWTAVMQQVEAGKIDLDADINQYLDFKIPAYQGKPITMRHLMTHTAASPRRSSICSQATPRPSFRWASSSPTGRRTASFRPVKCPPIPTMVRRWRATSCSAPQASRSTSTSRTTSSRRWA